MLESHIQGSGIHVKRFENRRFVHRHAHAVRTEQLLELSYDAFGSHRRRLVIVRKA